MTINLENTLPISIAASKSLDRLVVISVDQNFEIYLNYWSSGKVSVKRLSKITKDIKLATCLEVSRDSKSILLAGCDRMDLNKGRPVIVAFSFDGKFEQISKVQIQDKNMKSIYRMKRLPKSDAYVVSGERAISLVEFINCQKIQELKQLRNLHSGEIFDFVLKGKEIFSVSPEDNYVHKF